MGVCFDFDTGFFMGCEEQHLSVFQSPVMPPVSPKPAGAQPAHAGMFWGKCDQAQPTCELLIHGHPLNTSGSFPTTTCALWRITMTYATSLSLGSMHDEFS